MADFTDAELDEIMRKCRAWYIPFQTVTGDVQLYLDAADAIAFLRKERRPREPTPAMVDISVWRAMYDPEERK